MKRIGEMRTLGDVRIPFAAPFAALMSVVAGLAVLYLTRRFDFYYDEWDFVLGAPHWTLRDYFLPHSEHWSTIPAAIYRVLMLVVGARSYTPYMAVLMVLHGAAAFLLFLIVRRRAGDVLGVVASASLLLLGHGYENILWAFQIGFVGSVAYGLLAIWLLDVDEVRWWRALLASAALLASLMSSGIGLPFCAAVGGMLVADRSRWRRLWVLVVPVAAYLVWQATLGRTGLTSHRDPFTLVALEQLAEFVPLGVGAVAAGLAGFGAEAAVAAVAILALVVGVGWGRFGARPVAVGAALGVLAQFAVIGLVRAQAGDAQSASPRYVYIGSVFLLIVLTDIGGRLRLRSLWPPVVLVVAVGAVALNAVALRQAAAQKDGVFLVQDAELQTVWAMRDAPGLNRAGAVDPILMPNLPIGAYIESRSAHGSRLPDISRDGLGALPAVAVDQAMRQAFPITMRGRLATPPEGTCTTATSRTVSVSAREGSRVVIKAGAAGPISVWAWYAGPAPAQPTLGSANLVAGEDVDVALPRSGLGLTWHVQVREAKGGDAPTICVAS